MAKTCYQCYWESENEQICDKCGAKIPKSVRSKQQFRTCDICGLDRQNGELYQYVLGKEILKVKSGEHRERWKYHAAYSDFKELQVWVCEKCEEEEESRFYQQMHGRSITALVLFLISSLLNLFLRVENPELSGAILFLTVLASVSILFFVLYFIYYKKRSTPWGLAFGYQKGGLALKILVQEMVRAGCGYYWTQEMFQDGKTPIYRKNSRMVKPGFKS